MDENENKEVTAQAEKTQRIWKLLCLVLTAGILVVFFTLVLPQWRKPAAKEYGSLEAIDFSTSQWLDEYMEKTTGLFGKSFLESNAFSYGQGSGKMATVYASELEIPALRDQYKEAYAAEEYDRNDDTALHLKASLPQGALTVVNYFSQVCRVLSLELALPEATAQDVYAQLEAAFPDEALSAVAPLAELLSCEEYGCYVRYTYDDMNEYLYKNKPIFSRAYRWSGDFEALAKALDAESESSATDAANGVSYFRVDGNVIGLSAVETASGERLLSISFQFGG